MRAWYGNHTIWVATINPTAEIELKSRVNEYGKWTLGTEVENYRHWILEVQVVKRLTANDPEREEVLRPVPFMTKTPQMFLRIAFFFRVMVCQ